jgi:signal transduction histidine kinase
MRLLARREHELLALAELSQELMVSLDIYSAADLVLFNLMGQMGTSRAALWVVPEDEWTSPVLVRGHGLTREVAQAIGASCGSHLVGHLARERRLMLAPELESILEPAAAGLVRREDIALFAPILSRDALLGMLALGPRIGGAVYGPLEVQVLQTSLGMIGVSLHNAFLFNRQLENNRQLRLANEELKQLDVAKSEFLRNVNHELRTPLTIIIAYLSLLHESGPAAVASGDFITTSLHEAQKLQSLLENVLDFSAASEDRLEMVPEDCDLQALLCRFHEERLPGVSEGLREFSLETPGDLPTLSLDPVLLCKLLGVLVDNAVKFTPRGSRIRLRARVAESGEGSRVEIEVADDGPGIPHDRLPQLFESFRQGDGTTTRAIGGMGLGLALAHQLAGHMGGRLEVTSEPGRGSTFRLLLPAAGSLPGEQCAAA